MLCIFNVLRIYRQLSISPGYSEDQGAVGGTGVEDDMNALHLDEENEQPPLILETD